MKFASPQMQADYPLLPEPLRERVERADLYVQAKGWPELYVTAVGRTKADQRRIYTPYAERLVRELGLGLLKSGKDLALAQQLARMTPDERGAWAENRFSWHVPLCALDLRNRIYSRAQRGELMQVLRQDVKLDPSKWEILEHDVGRGDHIHVGYRDAAQRKRLLG